VRRGLAEFARVAGASEAAVIDIQLAVSEAATNAVLHAYIDRDPGEIRVIAQVERDRLRVIVRDDGRGMLPRSDSPGIGLGLPTIGQLTASFDVRDGPGGIGTEVAMVFDAPGVAAPQPETSGDWRVETLADVSALPGSAWPGAGVERLLDAVVPRVADVCAVDVIEAGQPRRLAARVFTDPTGELSAWLVSRSPAPQAMERMLPALREGDIGMLELSPEVNRTLAADEAEAERMNGLALRWWVNVPLLDGDVLLGTLGLGLDQRRPDPADEAAFLRALGQRAARGLAGAQLVEELRRTHRRFERILGALSEAVTVNDVTGRVVWANEAAVALLGAESLEEVLAAEPGELAARFEITGADGEPVALDDLPGQRAVAGESSAVLLTRSVHRATGRELWLQTKATRLDDEDETLVVNIIEDVTELKRAEQRLRKLAARHGLDPDG
jgi:PAS domain S-box-containing protein